MKKNTMLWIVVLSLVMPMLLPVFSYAYDAQPVIIADGCEYPLTTQPTQNEIGLMADAREICEVLALDCNFNPESKTFEIYDDKHGRVTFGHNATVFYSGDTEYKCAPFFYVQNGVPMVDIGMMCEMFQSSYTYNEEANEIVIEIGKISDTLPKVSVNDEISPLYIEPFETEQGLMTDLFSLASALNIEYAFESEETVRLYHEEKGNVYLTDSATTFESDFGTFDCAPLFFIENEIPMISARFFCELFDYSYTYEDATKLITIYTDMTMEELEEANGDVEIMSAYDATMSGTIEYYGGAPAGGADVELILQQVQIRSSNYGVATYYAGNVFTLGTIDFAEGEIYKDYSYALANYYSSSYPYYSLMYSVDEINEHAYINTSGGATSLEYPIFDTYYAEQDAKLYSATSSHTQDITIASKPALKGTISLANDALAPIGGLDVKLRIQTLSSLRTSRYGDAYYNVGYIYDLGDVHIEERENSADYRFVTDGFYSSGYPYYHLFYLSPDNDCVKPYGYLNSNNTIKELSSINLSYYTSYRTDARLFTLTQHAYAAFSLPLQDNYVSPASRVKPPVADKNSGKVYLGDKVTLTTQTEGATIYYTTDGTKPDITSEEYTSPIVIDSDMIIKAIAIKDELVDSFVSTYEYVAVVSNHYKLTANDEVGIIDDNVYYFKYVPLEINGELYCPASTIGEYLGLNMYWASGHTEITFSNGLKSLTFNHNDGNCCVTNSSTYVNAKMIFDTFLGDTYATEYKNGTLIAFIKKNYASEINDLSVTPVTGSGVVSFNVTNPTENMLVYVGVYDDNGALVSIKQAEISGDKAAAIVSLENASNLKIFAWDNGTLLPLSMSKEHAIN